MDIASLPLYASPLPPPAINLYITCCSDCTTRMLHMPKPVKPSLSQNGVKVLKLKLCQLLTWPYSGRIASSGLILQICLIMALSLSCSSACKSCIHGQWVCQMWYAFAVDAVSNSATVASPRSLAVFLPKIYLRTHRCWGVWCNTHVVIGTSLN